MQGTCFAWARRMCTTFQRGPPHSHGRGINSLVWKGAASSTPMEHARLHRHPASLHPKASARPLAWCFRACRLRMSHAYSCRIQAAPLSCWRCQQLASSQQGSKVSACRKKGSNPGSQLQPLRPASQPPASTQPASQPPASTVQASPPGPGSQQPGKARAGEQSRQAQPSVNNASVAC